MFFQWKQTSIIHNFTMVVYPVHKYKEKFRREVQWYVMERRDTISNVSFELGMKKDLLYF